MEIVIVADDQNEAIEIERLIQKVINKTVVCFKVRKACASIDTLAYINRKNPEIIALSAQIENMDNSDFFDITRNCNSQTIVFTQNRISYSISIRHNIAGFIVKPYTTAKVAIALDIALKKRNCLLAHPNQDICSSKSIILDKKRGGGGNY